MTLLLKAVKKDMEGLNTEHWQNKGNTHKKAKRKRVSV